MHELTGGVPRPAFSIQPLNFVVTSASAVSLCNQSRRPCGWFCATHRVGLQQCADLHVLLRRRVHRGGGRISRVGFRSRTTISDRCEFHAANRAVARMILDHLRVHAARSKASWHLRSTRPSPARPARQKQLQRGGRLLPPQQTSFLIVAAVHDRRRLPATLWSAGAHRAPLQLDCRFLVS